MYNAETTVAAISTPPGKGGVALIRISGKEAVEVAARCIKLRSGKALSDLPPRHAAYGDLYFEGEPIDDVVVTLFRTPHSYTGEDTAEICCHGGTLLTRTALAAILAAGAEQAGPGEFTRRAVLSGRLSLTEAEAISCLLEAKSLAQIRLSTHRSRSRLTGEIASLYEHLLSLISTLYAKIDYPEEDLADLTNDEILSAIQNMRSRTDALLASYRTGRAVNEGIETVLCGAPNVGKSALYNALAGEDLAIVTDYAGTTRDVLSTTLPLGQVLLRLHDTAGLREALDPVERIGVDRSRSHIEESELLLAVFDRSRPLTEEEHALLAECKKKAQTVVILLNKCDLPAAADMAAFADFPFVLPISAKTREGFPALTALVERLFTDGDIKVGEDAVVGSARQYAALCKAGEAFDRAAGAFAGGLPADIAASDLEVALAALAELDGHTVNEEIVAEIFRRFCVGK